jgi:exonuclease III
MLGYGGYRVAKQGWGDATGKALLCTGGTVTFIALSGLVLKKWPRAETIRFASWNVGSTAPRSSQLRRKQPLQAALTEMVHQYRCDVVCLQKTGEMSVEYLKEITPDDCLFVRVRHDDGSEPDSLIIWNRSRVNLVAAAHLDYSDRMYCHRPDAMALFQTARGTRFTVCSSYCREFGLNPSTQEERGRQATTVVQGDYQTIFNVKTMDQVCNQVHFEFYGGTLNARQTDRIAQRMTYLEENGFQTVVEQDSPTTFDMDAGDNGPAAVRLDHGFVRQGLKAVRLRSAIVTSQTLASPNRPSNHIPIGFDVQVA